MQDLGQILTSVEIMRAVGTVRERIISTYAGQVPKDESEGWAQLGLIRAWKEFDRDKMNGEMTKARLMSYLISKGFCRAVDEMRIAKVVDRTVGGKLRKTVVDAKAFSCIRTESHDGYEPITYDPADVRVAEPGARSVGKDFYEWAVSRLDRTDADLLYYYYVCKLPMRQIGMLFTCSESRVSQNHTRILNQLRGEYQATARD